MSLFPWHDLRVRPLKPGRSDPPNSVVAGTKHVEAHAAWWNTKGKVRKWNQRLSGTPLRPSLRTTRYLALGVSAGAALLLLLTCFNLY